MFLWWRADSRQLRAATREAIASAELVFVSAATAWEAGIKAALGRLRIPDTVAAGIADSGFEELPISVAHAEAAAALPPLHADPFDRMLVAQARVEGLTLVTRDGQIRGYAVDVLWA